MMNKTVEAKAKQQCCGCGMCVFVCPTGVIHMEYDYEGFNYPSVNSVKCTNCGKCLTYCPFNFNSISDKIPFGVYIARSKDNEVMKSSASGGLFTAVSDYILNQNGVVYGVAYDKDFMPVHTRADTAEARNKQRDSKYVQSDMSNVYQSVEQDIRNGRKVLFTGTPCQVKAINEYLNNLKCNTELFYTCDIICHGVSSRKVWKEYLKFIRDQFGDIENIKIRNKEYGSGYHMTIQASKGTYHKHEEQDPFIDIFQKNYPLRQSCFNCPMKNMDRPGDITIGDFQKAKQYYPDYADKKGVSVVLINTPKGNKIFNIISETMCYKACKLEEAMQVNLVSQIELPVQRDIFFELLRQNRFKQALKKYTEFGLINRLTGSMKRNIKKVLHV